MKKSILLINPPTGLYVRDDRCQSNVEDFLVSISRPPHEILIMATVLKQDGHDVQVRDYPIEHQTMDEFRHDIESLQPDVLVINTTLLTIDSDLECARIAKNIQPGISVAMRGGLNAGVGEHILKTHKEIDVIIWGESDVTLAEYLKRDDHRSVNGIVFRDDAQSVITTKPRSFLENLDSLPIVDRSLINNAAYYRPDTRSPLGLIEVSRGCPYSCVFCLVSNAFGKKQRCRSVSNIIKEINECVSSHQIYDFHFKSDIFSFDREWTVALCNAIIDNTVPIRWFANSRVDCLDEELLALMKRSGCFALSLGVESGSQKILDNIKKGITVEQIKETFAACREHGVETYSYFIIGFPWDTEETIGETIALSRIIDPTYVDFFFPCIFPGTELYSIMREHNLISAGSDALGYHQSYVTEPYPTMTLQPQQLIALRKKALRTFYLRPHYIAKTLFKKRRLHEYIRIIQFGCAALRKLLG